MMINSSRVETEGAVLQSDAGAYRGWAKRMIDVALILLAAPFVLPAVLVLAVAVSRDGSSPFYSQPRIGRGGKIFRMWKLRSMVPHAEQALVRHLVEDPAAKLEWDTTQKLRNDPRITPLGAILRKSSLDELPQLWNVFIGDMSLVGPRPMMVAQKPLYPGKAYYTLRPGVTGLWQTAGRHQTAFAARARYDETYASTLSFTDDAKIILRTFSVVFRGTGC